MNESTTRPWTRPYDWAEVVLGAVAALSPLWMTTDNAATWTLVVLGVLIALDGLASLARPGMVYGEGVQIVLGVLAFVSPWVIGFTEFNAASWTAWVVGILTVIAGAAAMPMANAEHTRIAGQH